MILPTLLLAVFTAAPPARPAPNVMPITKLKRAVLVPDLCQLRYRVSTSSETCQAYVDQALGYFYSYVWMEAARSFETALQHDPKCAFAHWGLARALEKITGDPAPLRGANRATAPMFIVNPLRVFGPNASALMSTHPPTSVRIQRLRAMGGIAAGG